MGSPKNRRAPHSSEGEKQGSAASYRDKEFFFENVETIFFQKSRPGAAQRARKRVIDCIVLGGSHRHFRRIFSEQKSGLE